MSSPMSSSSSSNPADQATNTPEGLSGNATGEVITVLVVVLFIFFVITLILYIKAKHYAGIAGRPLRRLHFAPDPAASRRPLDPSILVSLPVAVFDCKGGAADCAVCLSEFAEGEKVRVLPKCGHGFHIECIDMWFHSNSTCPLCRVQVGAARSVETSADDAAQVRIGVSSDEGSSSAARSRLGKLLAPAPVLTRGRDIEQGVRVE